MSDSVKTEKVDYSASIPMGPLGIAAVPGCEALVERVDAYLAMWRKDRDNEFAGYKKDSYVIDVDLPRFGSGEAKGVVNTSVRGDDLYIVADVTNYSLTYKMYGIENCMSRMIISRT